VVSQVVVGVGFLGGGAILKLGANVRGLTTAASLWATAAVGVGFGVGSYFISVVGAAAILIGLTVLRYPERIIRRRIGRLSEHIMVLMRPDADPAPVVSALSGLSGVELRTLTIEDRPDVKPLRADVRTARGLDLETALAELTDRDDVQSV